ncbi:MAG: repair protein RecN [Gemmatimonadetes bacterium]|nr:repair protein RecN [Gemmatimonadota bacterium]
MIAELRVRDLATIADVTLQLGPGLNVLSGETGAGKSMLVDALALLLGGRAESGLVRPGASRAVVEGAFDVPGMGLRKRVEALGLDLDDGRVVVRRDVSTEGRSRAWVNGSPTTATVLGELGAILVDLHGQHETESLLRPDAQRDMLDAFAGAERERAAVAEAHAMAEALRAEETGLTQRRDEVRRRADYLRHVVSEIDRAKLKPGEEEAVELEVRRLSQAGTLSGHALRISEAAGAADEGALAALARADRALSTLERADPTVAPWRELLDAAFANLDELARLATDYAQEVQDDPERLADLERRRDVLYGLFQKHGAGSVAVLGTRAAAAAELDLLDTADLDLRALATRRQAADAVLHEAIDQLSSRRVAATDRLARAVNKWLPRLGLPGGKFRVALERLELPHAFGQETAAFMVQLNAGLDERPLAKVASGGELSRLMLALKVVLARQDHVPTLVFDEVDQGIGGEIGVQVGEALAEVAERHQVLAITHLPQIAARADHHLMVSKVAKRGVATSDVAVIHGEDRVLEVARMLGGSESETARRHARELLARRESVKA